MTAKPTEQRVQCVSDFENSDFTAARREYVVEVPFLNRLVAPHLKNERDTVILQAFANIALVVFPIAATIFYFGGASWYVKGAYWLLLLVGFGEPFILGLHFSAHKNVFKDRKHYWVQDVIHNVLCPFFGLPGVIYPLHHVVMHHTENNHGLDLSATEPYQRDNLLHVATYMLRFVLLTPVELFIYAYRTQRTDWLLTLTYGFSAWLTGIFLLYNYVSADATFTVFIAPYFLIMTAMSFGNFAQHVFVNPDKPWSNENLAFNCCDSATNQRTYDDGYHVVHHIYGRMHWTELARHYWDNKLEYAKKGAWLFRKIHSTDVGVLVVTGQLEKLAREHYVHVPTHDGDKPPTVAEVVEMMKHRLKPVPAYISTRDKYIAKLNKTKLPGDVLDCETTASQDGDTANPADVSPSSLSEGNSKKDL